MRLSRYYDVNNKKLISRWDIQMWYRFILLPLLRITPPTEKFPWDDIRKILHGSQRIQNGEEILPNVSSPWHTNVADDRLICDSKDPNVTESRLGKTDNF